MNNLFNDKILSQKANNEIDLSKNNLLERRKYLNKWIDMLENGVLDKTKEEQLQGEFISDIFSKVLNASNITDGKEKWNLERETKTLMDGQKADGTLGFFDNKGKKDIRALIELKGANINLDTRQKRIGDTRSAVEQAFGYAPKYGKNCCWIIVSNFKEIRLYKANSMLEYQVFFLEKLRDDLEFKKFIYVLSFDDLVGTEKKKAKSLELSEEYQKVQNEIENKFYNEYKKIRIDIFENMKNNNPEVSELVIIEKVQKLLDRFLFICFCEDKGLIPNNSYSSLVKRGEIIEDVFESFKSFCNWINTGNKSKNIPHFNGGLFKPDYILDNLFVDDEVFRKLEKIADYDFESDLNESILGHIFEQSVSDIEELKKISLHEEFNKKESKRKKDGIFYTPKYITKYIVETVMNAWIEDKKRELGEDNLPELQEKDFKYDPYKKNYSKNFRKHVEFWENFREELRKIKIVDPACGSGAFLIEAFDFLLKYNQMIDEKIFNLTGAKKLFDDTTKEILENNIFGVDLNKESIEITKLSLWLRTANKDKTLATLENNIKCGNSLISDKNLTDKSFNWKEEFPEIFKDGGFDIVIGNPPYGAKIEKNIQAYLNEFYIKGGSETAISFMKLAHTYLLKDKGCFGFIIPKSFLFSSNYKNLREFLLEDIFEIIDCKKVWKEVKLEQAMLFFTKNKSVERFLSGHLEGEHVRIDDILDKITFSQFEFFLNGVNNKEILIANKMKKDLFYLGDISHNSRGGNFQKDIKNSGDFKVLGGADVQREGITSFKGFVDKDIITNDEKILIQNNSLLVQNLVAHIENPIDHIKITACLPIDKNYIILDTINQIIFNENYNSKVFWLILNSKLINWFVYKFILAKAIRTIHFDSPITNRIPLPKNFEQKPFIEKADIMLELNKELQNKIKKFKSRLSLNLDLKEFSKKMESFYELNFKEFLKELEKQKIKLSLLEQDEWEEYFENYKKSVLEIKQKIFVMDKEIDFMIYKLYELTDEEIKIIEMSF